MAHRGEGVPAPNQLQQQQNQKHHQQNQQHQQQIQDLAGQQQEVVHLKLVQFSTRIFKKTR